MKNPHYTKLFKRVLKKTNREILDQYFYFKGYSDYINLSPKDKEINKQKAYCQIIQDKLESLEEKYKGQILNDFQKVDFFVKASNENLAYLLKFLQSRTSFNINSLDCLVSTHDKVFFILLNHNQEFYSCYAIRSLDGYNERHWLARNDYFDDSIFFKKEDFTQRFEELKQKVQSLFNQELRGNQCQGTIDDFENNIYIFLDLQDYPQSIESFNGENIEEKDLNPVFEIIIIIDQEAKIVNTYADSREKRNELHQIIASVILKKNDLPLYSTNKDIFDTQVVLDRLRVNKRFVIDIPTESSIKDIYINKLVLLDWHHSEITLDTKQTNSKKQLNVQQDMIYEMLSDQKEFLNNEKYLVKSIQFIAIVDDGLPKNLKKKITINKQGLSNLGFEKIDEQLKNCFRESGIMKIAN